MIIPEVEDRLRLRRITNRGFYRVGYLFHVQGCCCRGLLGFWFSSVRSMGFDPAANQWASVLMTLAELVLACFLVFGARGLTELIRKVRGPEIS